MKRRIDGFFHLGMRAILSVIACPALFLFAAFLYEGVLIATPFVPYHGTLGMIKRYILIPWGVALCMVYLQRRAQAEPLRAPRWDLRILSMLFFWMAAPFVFRFGYEANASSLHCYLVMFFAIYAPVTEISDEARERMFALVCALFTALAFVLGSALLYCAFTVQCFVQEWGEFGFGLYKNMYCLCHGLHYNITGMVCLCSLMMCFAGCTRFRAKPMRALCALGAAIMLVCIVLTQSRTARYATIIALAAGVYGLICRGAWHKRAVIRHAAGILAACVFAVAAYQGASLLMDTALDHYARVKFGVSQTAEEAPAAESTAAPEAAAQDQPAVQTAPAEAPAATSVPTAAPTVTTAPSPVPTIVPSPVPEIEARVAVDKTLSGRTVFWETIIGHWKANPKYMIIGEGVGRLERLIDGYPAHNAYLHIIGTFGLIGFVLLAAFLVLVARPALRVFYSEKAAREPGDLPLCMMVIAALTTGLLENAPFGPMSPLSMMFMFALGMLYARGRKRL